MTTWNLNIRPGLVAFSRQVELDGSVFTLAFHFNGRDAHWRMDLTRCETVLLAGLKLVHGPLLAPYRHIVGLPPGDLRVHDREGRDADPGAEGLGDRVLLLYEEAA